MNSLTLRTTAIPMIWRNALLLGACVLLCDQLFWNAGVGINVGLGALCIAIVLIMRSGVRSMTGRAKSIFAAMLLCAVMIVLQGTTLSVIATLLLLALFSALMLEPTLRSVPAGIAQVLYNFVCVPQAFFESLVGSVPEKSASRRGLRWLKLLFFPIAALVVYYWIYRAANPKFEALTAGFIDRFMDGFINIFSNLFSDHGIFILLLMVLCGALIFKLAPGAIADAERALSDALSRVRVRRLHWKAPLSLNALDRERHIGMLLLIMMNAILLVVNVIDIEWVWFGFVLEEGFSLKQFVHEGTWLLIISILLSMAIMLRLFRRNLNFHPRAIWLRRAALLWIVQNAVLCISVCIRNAHYIGFHGLAYKRIAVIAFLVLVLIGLATLAWKIQKQRSVYYLWRVNGWALVAVITVMACFNWDVIIVEHNLGHPNPAEIDTDNYLALSDKVLPLLHAHEDVVAHQMEKHGRNRELWTATQDPTVFREGLERRTASFMERWRAADLRSWTWAEQRTYDHLLKLTEQTK